MIQAAYRGQRVVEVAAQDETGLGVPGVRARTGSVDWYVSAVDVKVSDDGRLYELKVKVPNKM